MSAVVRPERLVSTRISERGPTGDIGAGGTRSRRLEGSGQGSQGPSAAPGRYQRAQNAPGRPVLPRHVLMCQNGHGAIYTWTRGNAERVLRRPYRCVSWRHDGPCARREAATTFARMREALERPEFDPRGWIFAVLTLDRNGFYGGKRWTDVQAAFRELSRFSRNFLARVRRLCERHGWTSPGSNWVATVEAHRSGWPHCNFAIYAPELAAELEAERERVRSAEALRIRRLRRQGVERAIIRRELDAAKRRSILLSGELLEAATSTGWGRQSTAERVRDRSRLTAYMIALAGEAGATSAELAKLTQLPRNAYEKFRRLRSGKGFLPPRRTDPEVTGTMVRREFDPQKSAFGALPLHEVKDEAMRMMVRKCAAIEGDRIEREIAARRAAREGFPFVPPRPVETFRLIGENFVLEGDALTVDGETGFAVDADGGLKWSPAAAREGPGSDGGE